MLTHTYLRAYCLYAWIYEDQNMAFGMDIVTRLLFPTLNCLGLALAANKSTLNFHFCHPVNVLICVVTCWNMEHNGNLKASVWLIYDGLEYQRRVR